MSYRYTKPATKFGAIYILKKLLLHSLPFSELSLVVLALDLVNPSVL